MIFSRFILAIATILCLTVSADAGQRLSEAQISALAPGSYVGTWKGKRQLNLKLSEDGTIAGTVDGKYHSGKWYVSKGNLCLVFRFLILQKTKCGSIHREGEWIVGYYKKGKPRIRLRAASNV